MEENKKPLVSVIVPCYNYGHLIKECVDSLAKQTYSNWECIIVDDGSTDNSKKVIAELIESDKRVFYFSQANAGPTVARNLGLSKAKGAFVQFLDADDLIESMKFELQLKVFDEQPDCDIVYSSVNYFSGSDKSKLYDDISLEGSKPWMKKISGSGEKIVSALLNENLMVINSALIRRSLFEKYGAMDEALFYNEDWELWTRFAIGNAKFQFDDSPGTLALVRVHQSYSRDEFKMYLYGLLACLKINEKLKGHRYKKIMMPKINYHKRIIDEKLIEKLKTDKAKAIEFTLLVFKVTGLKRYSLYSKLFNVFPVVICFAYTRFLFLIHKLKNIVFYA